MSALIEKLRAGDEGAAAEVFGRFVGRLTALARVHLSKSMRSKEDAEDVIQSVFRSFFRRQRAGQFTLESWDNIWGVLAVITLRKCGNRIEYFHAASRDVHREVSLSDAAAWLAMAREPTPVEAATLTEMLEHLMAGLEPTDRAVLTLHLQDYTVPEICAQVGYAERTVWRSLNRIRNRLRRLEAERD
jgi:RNA polymerase sigma-70 factor (ECF subfamily)